MTKKPPGLTRAADLLPTIESLQSAIRQSNESNALTVQGKHHYTREKQMDSLQDIGETQNPEMGFMSRMLTLCSLPRTDVGDRLQYKRQNGPYKLIMIAGGDNKLPYGNLPRLLLAWVCTEVVRTRQRQLTLGSSLASFMHELGIYSDSGGRRGDRTRLKTQIDRLFNCHIDMIYEPKGQPKAETGGRFAPKTVLWWDYKTPEQQTLFQSWILLGEELFNEIIKHPVPLDMRILKAMRRSSLGLDLYMWLSYKTFALYREQQRMELDQQQGRMPRSRARASDRRSWTELYIQFGSDPALASDKTTVQNFRKDVLREITKLKLCWPQLDVITLTGRLEIRACQPSITPKAI